MGVATSVEHSALYRPNRRCSPRPEPGCPYYRSPPLPLSTMAIPVAKLGGELVLDAEQVL